MRKPSTDENRAWKPDPNDLSARASLTIGSAAQRQIDGLEFSVDDAEIIRISRFELITTNEQTLPVQVDPAPSL
jgi:hypothetical protein